MSILACACDHSARCAVRPVVLSVAAVAFRNTAWPVPAPFHPLSGRSRSSDKVGDATQIRFLPGRDKIRRRGLESDLQWIH